MRIALLAVVSLLAVALATAAVVPKEFHSSHGHKKHQKESEREEALGEHGPVKEPVKVRTLKHSHEVAPLKPIIHPIPSHPPPHADAAPNHHHRSEETAPKPVIHPIPSHPPPVVAGEAPAPQHKEHKEHVKKEE